jgi:hypothetical protein
MSNAITAPTEQPRRAPGPDLGIRATTIKLPVPTLTALKTMAVERRVPTNDLMVEAIEDFLRLHGRRVA